MPRLSTTISDVPLGSTRSPAIRPIRDRFSDPLMMPSRAPDGVDDRRAEHDFGHGAVEPVAEEDVRAVVPPGLHRHREELLGRRRAAGHERPGPSRQRGRSRRRGRRRPDRAARSCRSRRRRRCAETRMCSASASLTGAAPTRSASDAAARSWAREVLVDAAADDGGALDQLAADVLLLTRGDHAAEHQAEDNHRADRQRDDAVEHLRPQRQRARRAGAAARSRASGHAARICTSTRLGDAVQRLLEGARGRLAGVGLQRRRRSSRRGSARRRRSRSRPRPARSRTGAGRGCRRRRPPARRRTSASGGRRCQQTSGRRDGGRERRPRRTGGDRHAQHDHHVEPHRQAGAERRRADVGDQSEQAGGERQRQLTPRLAPAGIAPRPSGDVGIGSSARDRARRSARSAAPVCSDSRSCRRRGIAGDPLRTRPRSSRRSTATAGSLLDAARRLQAVELGHLHVHEDDVVAAALDRLHRPAPSRRRRLVAEARSIRTATRWFTGLSSAISKRGRRPAARPPRGAVGRAARRAASAALNGSSRRTSSPRPAGFAPHRPPISSTRRLLMARPRPVPPKRRVIESSACTNGSKSRELLAARCRCRCRARRSGRRRLRVASPASPRRQRTRRSR